MARILANIRYWVVIAPGGRWLAYLFCAGKAPALTWIGPIGGRPGYYRGGIQAQYCCLPRWHPGRCLAPIDGYGRNRSTLFTPQEKP